MVNLSRIFYEDVSKNLPLKKSSTPMSAEKNILHPRNQHRSRYDFPELIKSLPELKAFVRENPYGDLSVDFSDPNAVKSLNKALLKHFYQINHWDIPEGYLCPPIPGRADYIHYLADLLADANGGEIPKGSHIRGLDVGIGANCIYPIIGHQEYGWSFTGSDVDAIAVRSAENIAAINPALKTAVEVRIQHSKNQIFKGLVRKEELYDFTLCNPPFHASAAEALSGAQRKVRNLGKGNRRAPVLNFGGKNAELWFEGGEIAFAGKMIEESIAFQKQCFCFSTLLSKSTSLPFVYAALERAGVQTVRTVEMAQGQKVSRFVAWTFLNEAEQQAWSKKRWRNG